MTIKPIGFAALLTAAITFAITSSSSAGERMHQGHAGLLMQVDDDDDDDDRPRRAVRGHYRSYHTDRDDRRWQGRHYTQRYAKACRTVWMHDGWGRSWWQTYCR